ncbi:DUF202 domain-containing protein [Herbiconiux sp.]|uniref:DUF202 domain-containing protein n=1 Tax=Herbiconiux sp. TaxID=1871186 RepID=UPI0025C6F3C2|nr:DUF202 domain-containing protein [Herbiconiux sp.]
MTPARSESTGAAGRRPRRTVAAWQRTALSVSIIALVFAFVFLKNGFVFGTVVGVLVAIAGVLALFGLRRYRVRGSGAPAWTPFTRAALVFIAVAIIGAVVILLIAF